jgi:hypothetical protein
LLEQLARVGQHRAPAGENQWAFGAFERVGGL